mgnify:CR=1 FL=1
MKEKIKWFGRYLGCDMLNPSEVRITLNEFNIGTSIHFKYRLILKELKDISDQDLKELNEIAIKVCGISEVFSKRYMCADYLYNTKEIDFLRSKGYAVGIPKEYYITEEELK